MNATANTIPSPSPAALSLVPSAPIATPDPNDTRKTRAKAQVPLAPDVAARLDKQDRDAREAETHAVEIEAEALAARMRADALTKIAKSDRLAETNAALTAARRAKLVAELAKLDGK